MKNLDHYLEEAIKNIQDDREVTRELLDDVIRYISKNEEHHKFVGGTAAKYVETLQRSNEQLVKIVNMMSKQTASDGLTDKDLSNIYEMINEEE